MPRGATSGYATANNARSAAYPPQSWQTGAHGLAHRDLTVSFGATSHDDKPFRTSNSVAPSRQERSSRSTCPCSRQKCLTSSGAAGSSVHKRRILPGSIAARHLRAFRTGSGQRRPRASSSTTRSGESRPDPHSLVNNPILVILRKFFQVNRFAGHRIIPGQPSTQVGIAAVLGTERPPGHFSRGPADGTGSWLRIRLHRESTPAMAGGPSFE